MKTAIIHDWLVNYAGAEAVLAEMLKIYPGADIFTLVDFLPAEARSFLQGRTVSTSCIQALPAAKKYYRNYLPLMPLAVEQFDLSGYELVLSSSHAVAKGVLTGPGQLHISYVHSPMRYAWDLQHQYLQQAGLTSGIKAWLTKWLLHRLRLWDVRTANGVDLFIANSRFIARRIWKIYRRKAVVIYPPVDTESFSLCEDKDDYYIAASRLVPYKRMDLIVEAFGEMPDKRLVVIGGGPDEGKIRRKLSKNITFLGYQPKEKLISCLQRARALVFAAEEDFGITPVEAQACGAPVIAYGRGGVTESIIGDGGAGRPTGVFFSEQRIDSLKKAVQQFEARSGEFSPQACSQNALRFSRGRFRQEYERIVDVSVKRHAGEGNIDDGWECFAAND
ncbi:MAG TPA: glycosyltransferase family 4 protein [Methylomusa anaerophila]|uniref:GDP-mannose-dependent alpha-(1-6)-phosphatidylinositol monomannoside mannosyltransferase n=1 Tax=Methylomusa anaerophila TaxID=1930071 RepID=A0A348AKN4_9FIRM|nr:glycosyltransferase family 4 protein [Methylomusa anaerophila]BBB91632.1 GDP-mannose-dependent alpha-(1-6)-phosphatidylinositol monomannoside mannosyltransferase [Methylomusa anaerophila]HML89430.1 glycosyltransferase family 4 protein [Methylomusa anaerophila]